MSYKLRRGKTTDAIFDRAVKATSVYTSTHPETGRRVERVESMSVPEARDLFNSYKRAKMMKRSDGTFVFLIGTHVGDERIELEIA